MSIETLLEAAKFLELQAQQQQKAREENELREKMRLQHEAEQQRAAAASRAQPVRMNHITWTEEAGPERRHAPPAPPPLPPPPSSVPITVIPIPVVSSNPSAIPPAPAAALSPPVAPRLAPPSRKDAHSPPSQPAPHQRALVSSQVKAEPTSLTQPPNIKQTQPQLLQPYQGSIVTASQHALLPQPGPPSAQPSPIQSRASPPEDHRHIDGKKRPGGAGTREVHNKLEKNRRAHLKECFETLKKNIPNVDEKKTSNLSVLRSALRYIQTLKRKEKEFEHEMERLAREKIATQQRLAELKNELSQWMDVMEIDRVLRQTVQPEDDQASTSTASEGEDNIDEDMEEENVTSMPSTLHHKVPHVLQPELRKSQTSSSILAQHIIPHHKAPQPQPVPQPAQQVPTLTSTPSVTTTNTPTPAQTPNGPIPTSTPIPPQALPPTHTHIVTTSTIQPTVIAHAAAPASHASVIQAVNHVIQAGSKHIAHIAPSTSNSVQLAPGPQPIGHITVHPVAHLPAIYQTSTVTQPAVMSQFAHTLSHSTQVNGNAAPSQQAAAMVGKQAAVGAQVVAHHPQLVGQTVLNPVTMVTMPPFPVSTLKLA
ncbi:max-binding protein MNT [Chanos chanos]|uniref:Max-binding protein MNT n=1 Tax=Chanos chanos TaxID=29144 RepID=A0A6J2VLZ5_CHACN|nr:max-binding protein MNT [Chanos chanos]